MPAPRKLPDNTILRTLRAQGHLLKDIAKEYDVTEAAVWKALERAGYTDRKETYKDIVPWDIDPKHRSTAITQRFRSIMRQRRGQELNQTEEHLLNAWLKSMKDNNVVLDYHVDAPPNDASRLGGFFYTPRLPEDEGFIRMPKKKPAETKKKRTPRKKVEKPAPKGSAVLFSPTLPGAAVLFSDASAEADEATG
jgi:hypothetical protein